MILYLCFILIFCICSIPSNVNAQLFPFKDMQDCWHTKRTDCFNECASNPVTEWWGPFSDNLLGKRRNRGIEYDFCQSECIQKAHVDCTVEVGHSYQLFGKWPMRKIFIFEEFVSFIFCTLATIQSLWIYFKYTKETTVSASSLSKSMKHHDEFPFRNLYRGYYLWFSITFATAALFHTKDTPLTEKLDYYTAFIALINTLYCGTCRVFWIDKLQWKVLTAIPFVLFAVNHLYYMNFVRFDYAWNMTLLVIVSILHSFLWIGWSFKNSSAPYLRWMWIAMVSLWCMSVFELLDFPPLFQLADPHSLWHAGIIFAAFPFAYFLISDAKYNVSGIKGKLP